MALNLYNHGNCCGANIIDGFWSKKVYRADYEAQGRDPEWIENAVSHYQEHHEVLEDLKDILDRNKNSRGQFMVILNDKQNRAFQDDLVNLFGFQLLYSDVSNPNHNHTDAGSRLWTYIYVSHPFYGTTNRTPDEAKRTELGLSAEPVRGRPASEVIIPGLPTPVPPFRIPPANLPYGVRL